MSDTPRRPGVLVMDRDEALLRLLERILLRQRYDVSLANATPAALELLTARPYDVVLLEDSPPRASASDLIHRIDQSWPSTGIVVMTSSPETTVARTAPFDVFLAKPFRTLFDVVNALKTAITQRQGTRSPEPTLGPRIAGLEGAGRSVL